MGKNLSIALLAFFLLQNTTVHSQDPDQKAGQNPPTAVRSLHSTKLDLAVPLCPGKFEDGLAKNGIAFRGEDGISPAKPAGAAPDPEMTKEARRKLRAPYDLEVTLNGVVDVNGVVEDVCLSRSVGYGLDANAANILRKTQFTPATNGGKPVPFRTDIEYDFRSY
jgi:TonB family protein